MAALILLMVLYYVFVLAILILTIVGQWKVFKKAGKPGWASIIPIYNMVVMLEIAKKPVWWVIVMLLVPIVNIVFLIMTYHGISKAFGKGGGFTAGLIFFPFIFWPILGLSKDIHYQFEPSEDLSGLAQNA